MKKNFLLACLIGATLAPVTGHAATYALNTGPGDPLAPRNYYQQDPFLGNQWLAVQFSIAQPSPLISVNFFLNGEGTGGTGTFALYAGAALPTLGTEIFTAPLTVPPDMVDGWYGVNNMSVQLAAGTYWAALEGRGSDQVYASLLSGTANPAAAYAYSDGVANYATMAGQLGPDFGAQIVVPEPGVLHLLGAGFMMLGLLRWRRAGQRTA